ncbi:MAG: bifunctional diaminohydroxyphosphoribosylaminopyrimidine deaminase/5-amino-6-(5-phosphoribosylamino)uracil reductase RibD [Chitinispirillales bacterium]|jgi:diaminohydroxyphosphoribosylaminopyrimidine deaminase/5-amino-6-(5-phosphoribosylamino)uracil reductase|nr:bifunctional diaminohydroxyphosphoribosylaminopyrimidine deaminase/5-amino-6-(5-phosphoribosylamino)uracil reductase RibD [Chitinispirillales bacterium]
MKFSDLDNHHMQRALALARKAKGTTFPNPAVGAVVVDAGGKVVGEGATSVCGGPHAEKLAIKKAGAAARGATMFVTLEPCVHFGRTPSCVDEIIEAGVKKVITAVKDPNPLVNGKGLRKLKAHGIDVQTGLLARSAVLVNEDYCWSIVNKRPWVSIKLAMTLDGRIADCDDKSKWITSEASRREVQEIRRYHSAIAVGRHTLLSDDPKLTARCGRKTYYPARIVFSSTGNIPADKYFLTHADEARTIVVIGNSKKCVIERIDNVEYWYLGKKDVAESINTFLEMAYAEGLTSVLIEGGQKLASNFLEHDFVNKAYLFYGNKIFGNGKNGLMFSKGLPIENSVYLDRVEHRSFGDDFFVSGYVNRI